MLETEKVSALTPDEIADVEVSLAEIKAGKAKKFKTADALIKELKK